MIQSKYHRAKTSHHRSKRTIQSSFKIINAQYDASSIETQPFYDESYFKIQLTRPSILVICHISKTNNSYKICGSDIIFLQVKGTMEVANVDAHLLLKKED